MTPQDQLKQIPTPIPFRDKEGENFNQTICCVCKAPTPLSDLLGTCSKCRDQSISVELATMQFERDNAKQLLTQTSAQLADWKKESDKWEKAYDEILDPIMFEIKRDSVAPLETEAQCIERIIKERNEAKAKLAVCHEALREICQTNYDGSNHGTPFQFEQKIHGIAHRVLQSTGSEVLERVREL